MENLDIALEGKELKDLETAKAVSNSNLIEPTKAEIEDIVADLVEGKSYKEIKKSRRRVVMDGEVQVSAKGFSYGQIKEIDIARKAKIVELTPEPEEVIK